MQNKFPYCNFSERMTTKFGSWVFYIIRKKFFDNSVSLEKFTKFPGALHEHADTLTNF